MERYLIWLSQVKGIGTVLQKRLLEAFESPEAVYHAHREELMAVQGIGTAATDSILNSLSLEQADRILEKADQLRTKILSCFNPLYPELVKKLPRAPIVLILPMPEWQKIELEKRYNDYKCGYLKLHDWNEVHEGLRKNKV